MSIFNTPKIALSHLDQLWFQVTGTRCNLACHHCFISCSPHNREFGWLTLEQVRDRLNESMPLGVKEYYFTGGEPFLHPDLVAMVRETLHFGPATVLTNGTVLKAAWLEALREASEASCYSLEFRVSIDGFTAETNDPIRGEGTFERAMQGVEQLVAFGFLPIITAARSWPEDEDADIVGGFLKTLRKRGYPRPRLKLLPMLQMGAEASRTTGYRVTERVTSEMMTDFDASQLICHHSRIVTDRGVHVCPILIEHPRSLLGETLADARRPFAMDHGACLTCYQYGAICSNPSGGLARGWLGRRDDE